MASELMSIEDQARLELTLSTRGKIIQQLTKNGSAIPESNEDRDLLMKALDGMDRTVLTKAKIKSDDSSSKSQAEASKMIAQLLLQSNNQVIKKRDQPVILEADITVIPVPGETDIGIETFTYKQLIPPV